MLTYGNNGFFFKENEKLQAASQARWHNISIIYNQMVNTAVITCKNNINHHTVGRETNFAKYCDDGMVAITDAALSII